MPFVRITTSLKREQVTPSAVAAISKGFSEILGVEEEHFNLVITTDQIFCKAGDQNKPAADVVLSHIGDCSPEGNEAIAGKVTELLEKQLNLPQHQFYVTVYPIKPADILLRGHTGQVLLEMLAAQAQK